MEEYYSLPTFRSFENDIDTNFHLYTHIHAMNKYNKRMFTIDGGVRKRNLTQYG